MTREEICTWSAEEANEIRWDYKHTGGDMYIVAQLHGCTVSELLPAFDPELQIKLARKYKCILGRDSQRYPSRLKEVVVKEIKAKRKTIMQVAVEFDIPVGTVTSWVRGTKKVEIQ